MLHGNYGIKINYTILYNLLEFRGVKSPRKQKIQAS